MGNAKSNPQFLEHIEKVRAEERERAANELNNATREVRLQMQQEMKKLIDANLERDRTQQEVINKLQQQEKICSSMVESLRSNLAETQQQLVIFDQRVGQLETQVLEEQQVSASRKKKAEELESELQLVTKENASEKVAREEALAKISALELVINASTRDLDFERQKLKGARDRITLMETQLRSFYSTVEEINHLFAKQQDKLEAMQKALEEKESDQNVSVDVDQNPQIARNMGITTVDETKTGDPKSNATVEATSTSSSVDKEGVHDTSSDRHCHIEA